jgi:hypothetical protein
MALPPLRAAVVAATALAAAAGCVDDGGPRLDAAEPAAAARRATVHLIGRRLCGDGARCEAAGGAVRLGADPPIVQATVLAYADTEAQIQIPDVAPLGPTALIVTVNERASNALAFEVLP